MRNNLIINYTMAEIQGEMNSKKSKNECATVVAEQQLGYCSTLIGYIVEHHPISMVQTT